MSTDFLEIDATAREMMMTHAVREYPAECCGILMGQGNRVVRTVAAQNVAEAGRERDRYVVEPLAIVKAERAGRGEGLEIVGFYHSHPDCAAAASATDARLAWAGYVYVIVSVVAGKAAEMRAWRLNDGSMQEMELRDGL